MSASVSPSNSPSESPSVSPSGSPSTSPSSSPSASTGLDMGTSDFTIEFGVRTSDVSIPAMISKDDGSDDGWIIAVDATGKLTCVVGDGTDTATVTSLNVITDDKWHHVLIIGDRSEVAGLKMYIDNELVGTTADDFTDVDDISGAAVDLTCTGVANKTFYLSTFGIWSKALTSAERAVRTGNGRIGSKFIGDEDGLILAFNLDEGTGTAGNPMVGVNLAKLTGTSWADGEGLPVDAHTLTKVGRVLCTANSNSDIVFNPPMKIGRNNPMRIDETDGAFTLLVNFFRDMC